MASNLDLSEEIEQNRINEIIEATLIRSAAEAKQQEIKNLKFSSSNIIPVSTSAVVPKARIDTNQTVRFSAKPRVSQKIISKCERKQFEQTNQQTFSYDKPNSQPITNLSILLKRQSLNSQKGNKIISRPIRIPSKTKPYRSRNENSNNKRPRSLVLERIDVLTQNTTHSSTISAVKNITMKKEIGFPGPNRGSSMMVHNNITSEKEDSFNYAEFPPASEVLSNSSERDDILATTADIDCEKKKKDITVSLSPSPHAFSFTQDKFLSPKASLNESFENRRTFLLQALSGTASMKSLTNTGGMPAEKLMSACENVREVGQSENISSSLGSAISDPYNIASTPVSKQNMQSSSIQLAHRSFSEPPYQKATYYSPSSCNGSQPKTPGIIEVQSIDTLETTADIGCEKEKKENSVSLSPSPHAFSFTQGKSLSQKASSNESFENRRTNLLQQLSGSASLKSLTNTGGMSAAKLMSVCENASEVGQSENISSSLESALPDAYNVPSIPARKQNIQRSSTKLAQRSFSEPPNQKVTYYLPLNCNGSQPKTPDIIEVRSNEDDEEVENLPSKIVINKSAQLLLSLMTVRNMAPTTKESLYEGDRPSFVEKKQTSLPKLPSTITGMRKNAKPALPPRPRLKLKENATDVPKKHSSCENEKLTSTLSQKLLDETFSKQTDDENHCSLMNNDAKKFLNEKSELSSEVSKVISSEYESHTFPNNLNEDVLRILRNITKEVIANTKNITSGVKSEENHNCSDPETERTRTSLGEGANSCNISPLTRSPSMIDNVPMTDAPRRKTESFTESQGTGLDLSVWAPPRPSLPQKLRTTHRSLSCSSLVQTFKELGFLKKYQPFSGKNKIAEHETSPVSTASEKDFHSSPWHCDVPSYLNKKAAWFHDVESTEANRRLLVMGQDGAFLVRPSSQVQEDGPARLTVCVTVAGRVLNLRVRQLNHGAYALGSHKPGELTFQSLTELIKYHQDVPLEVMLGGVEGKRNVRFLVTPPKEVF